MIAIVDFGGQLTLLIARRLRELKIKPVLLNPEDVQKTAPVGVCGVILSGGPNSVTAADTRVAKKILAWHLPVLGICFGHQLLAKTMGGKVATNKLTQR